MRGAVANLMSQEEVHPIPPRLIDEEKMHANCFSIFKLVFGIPPYFFEHIIKVSKSDKEILDMLKNLSEVSENVKDKRLTYMVNE